MPCKPPGRVDNNENPDFALNLLFNMFNGCRRATFWRLERLPDQVTYVTFLSDGLPLDKCLGTPLNQVI